MKRVSGEFEIIEHKELPGLKVFFVNMQYRSAHAHSDFECCLLLDGYVHITAGGQTIMLSPGDFVPLRPCLAHEIRAGGKGALLLAIQIRPSLLRGWSSENSLDFAFISAKSFMSVNELSEFNSRALELARCYIERCDGWEFGCMGSAGLLLRDLTAHFPKCGAAAGRNNRRQARMMRILSFVEDNCTRKLLLSEIARSEGVTVSYLSHFFRENFHISFQEYLSSLRCERARTLLADRGRTLLDISVECGFSDVKYFNRAFSERFGRSPREYRAGMTQGPGENARDPEQEFLSEERSLRLLDSLQCGKGGCKAWTE